MRALPPDTERLHFSWWRESDLGGARALWGDPRVTALIDKRERLPEAEIAQRLRTETDNAARLGTRAVLEKLGFVKIDEWVYPPTGLVHPWYRVLVTTRGK